MMGKKTVPAAVVVSVATAVLLESPFERKVIVALSVVPSAASPGTITTTCTLVAPSSGSGPTVGGASTGHALPAIVTVNESVALPVLVRRNVYVMAALGTAMPLSVTGDAATPPMMLTVVVTSARSSPRFGSKAC